MVGYPLIENVGGFDSRGMGERVMLGTDGMHSDMLRSAKAAYFSGQQIESIGLSSIYKRFRMGHQYIQENGFIGDRDNNLVILNYNSPTEVTEENFLSHFLYGLESNNIESVISSGKLILKDRKLVTCNEEDILSHSREMGKKLWHKMQ